MNDLIGREVAIDAIYKNHMNGKEGVKQDVENLYGSAACFSETLQDAVESIEELPTVPAIPISVIDQIKAEIQEKVERNELGIEMFGDYMSLSRMSIFAYKQTLEIIDKALEEYEV